MTLTSCWSSMLGGEGSAYKLPAGWTVYYQWPEENRDVRFLFKFTQHSGTWSSQGPTPNAVDTSITISHSLCFQLENQKQRQFKKEKINHDSSWLLGFMTTYIILDGGAFPNCRPWKRVFSVWEGRHKHEEQQLVLNSVRVYGMWTIWVIGWGGAMMW